MRLAASLQGIASMPALVGAMACAEFEFEQASREVWRRKLGLGQWRDGSRCVSRTLNKSIPETPTACHPWSSIHGIRRPVHVLERSNAVAGMAEDPTQSHWGIVPEEEHALYGGPDSDWFLSRWLWRLLCNSKADYTNAMHALPSAQWTNPLDLATRLAALSK